MVSRDIRYKIIKPMLKEGDIQKFTDIFNVVPISVVAVDMGKRTTRFKKLVEDLETIKLEDFLMIGRLCMLSSTEILFLVDNELIHRKIKT